MVTTQANELMSEIHNTKQRMPIILKQENEQHWLYGEDYNDFKFPYSNNLEAHSENPNTSSQLDLF
jgi:putative SOS response-associated peptidase YedK